MHLPILTRSNPGSTRDRFTQKMKSLKILNWAHACKLRDTSRSSSERSWQLERCVAAVSLVSPCVPAGWIHSMCVCAKLYFPFVESFSADSRVYCALSLNLNGGACMQVPLDPRSIWRQRLRWLKGGHLFILAPNSVFFQKQPNMSLYQKALFWICPIAHFIQVCLLLSSGKFILGTNNEEPLRGAYCNGRYHALFIERYY
jgi:hypothetical protein